MLTVVAGLCTGWQSSATSHWQVRWPGLCWSFHSSLLALFVVLLLVTGPQHSMPTEVPWHLGSAYTDARGKEQWVLQVDHNIYAIIYIQLLDNGLEKTLIVAILLFADRNFIAGFNARDDSNFFLEICICTSMFWDRKLGPVLLGHWGARRCQDISKPQK